MNGEEDMGWMFLSYILQLKILTPRRNMTFIVM